MVKKGRGTMYEDCANKHLIHPLHQNCQLIFVTLIILLTRK